MDSVHRNAELTIVAAAGLDETFGLPGVSLRGRQKQLMAQHPHMCVISTMSDPQEAIRDSVWFTRGWTLQEGILSRRRLVFTDSRCALSATLSTAERLYQAIWIWSIPRIEPTCIIQCDKGYLEGTGKTTLGE